MSSESSIDFVLKTVEERDIRFVRLWFTDVLGHLKSFSISPEELEAAHLSEDLVRLSVGIEDVEDIIADLDQALAAL